MIRKGPIAILLLLCFSVVLVHSMVPHHHHHGVIAESSATCCDEHHDQCETDAHPQHCDAFNEINFFKSSSSRIDTTPEVNSLFQAALCSEVLQLNDRFSDSGFYVPRTILHIACPGGRTTSLRGPPWIA